MHDHSASELPSLRRQKILLILRTWLRIASGNVVPNYGTP